MASSKDNAGAYTPWPYTGESFSIAATVGCLAATNIAALAARLYVIVRHRQQMQHFLSTASICASHASLPTFFMLAQSASLIVACRYGWGSTINVLPQVNLHRAEVAFFASNVLLIPVHAFSRAGIGFTLLSASVRATPESKFAIAILACVPLWMLGSVLGVGLNRLGGSSFWLPIGKDCEFRLWGAISLVGLLIDVSTVACAARIIAPLQMGLTNKIFTISVFGVGILVNVPIAYAVAYLHQHSAHLASNPTLYSAPFIHANQAAIAVSLWCRVLEAARKLQQDMGYASYGHGSVFTSSYANSKRPTGYYAAGSKGSKQLRSPHNSKPKQSRADDEIELRPTDRNTMNTTRVEGGTTKPDQSWTGIEVSREYGYSTSAEDVGYDHVL